MLGAVTACGALGAPSKVRAGELYVSGSPRYDAYFGEVHAEQVAAAAWPDERKRARKPLMDALKLTGEASDATVVQMTKDGMSGGVLHLEIRGTEAHVVVASAVRHDAPRDLVIVGVEQTAQAEMARAKKLADLPLRLEDLAKAGHALEAHLGEDFGAQGQKPFDVRAELYVSYDAIAAISGAAKRERQLADQFVSDLGRAVSAGNEASVTPPMAPDKRGKPSGPAKPSRTDEPAKPARQATPLPANPPKPTPPPAVAKPIERTEVFSP